MRMGLKLLMGSSNVCFLFLFCARVRVRSHLLAQTLIKKMRRTKKKCWRLKEWIGINIAKICVQKCYYICIIFSIAHFPFGQSIQTVSFFFLFQNAKKKIWNEIYNCGAMMFMVSAFYSISGKVSDKNDSVGCIFFSLRVCLNETFLDIFFLFPSKVITLKMNVKKKKKKEKR